MEAVSVALGSHRDFHNTCTLLQLTEARHSENAVDLRRCYVLEQFCLGLSGPLMYPILRSSSHSGPD